MSTSVQTITLAGQRFVILPEEEYRSLVGDQEEPTLPAPDARGNYPAVEAVRVLLARKLIRRRRAVGLTQANLARLARVRVETISRLENGRHSPNVATIDKIVHALDRAERAKRK
ncbi:MAG: helix-turn-helix transcriptional regulator [Pirellulales bacterium]